LPAVAKVAAELRERLSFLVHRMEVSSAYMIDDIGLNSDQLPAIGGFASHEMGIAGYPFHGSTSDEAALRQWCNDLLLTLAAGPTEQPLLKVGRRTQREAKEEALAQPVAGSDKLVKSIVTEELEEVVFGGDRDTLVLFHLPYGGQVLFNNLERTARVLQGANVRVVTFSSYKNSFDSAKFLNLPERHEKTVAFICAAKPNCKLKKYADNVSLRSLLKFLKKHSPAVREHWASIQAAAAALAEVEMQAKATEAEKAKAFKRALAEAPRTNVTHDGGVVKRVIVHGDPVQGTPTAHSVVHLHHTGRLLSGDGDQPGLKFGPYLMGQVSFDDTTKLIVGVSAHAPRGLHIAVGSMQVGERAMIEVRPEYAYGTEGDKNQLVPANSALEYDVELLKIELSQQAQSAEPLIAGFELPSPFPNLSGNAKEEL